MHIGMLWFDNDPKADLPTKIGRAADYYVKKYGQTPNLVFVHPSQAPAPEDRVDHIEIRTNRSVLPNHLWMGVSEQSQINPPP